MNIQVAVVNMLKSIYNLKHIAGEKMPFPSLLRYLALFLPTYPNPRSCSIDVALPGENVLWTCDEVICAPLLHSAPALKQWSISRGDASGREYLLPNI